VKSLRYLLTSLGAIALVALLAGCGKSSSPTSLDPVPDNAPPAAPTGLHIVIDESTGYSTLAWDAPSGSNVGGFEIYAYSPSPDRDDAYLQIGETDETATQFLIPGGYQEGVQYFRMQAFNPAGNHSPFSATLQAVLPGPNGSTDAPPGGRPRPPRGE
jgi:hypothetical protein